MERIYVAVRVRPPTKQEIVKGSYWRVEDNHISLHNALGTPISGYSYAFDHVFGYDSKNASIYEVHTKDVIQAAVQGFNGTVFAYGQTSSGKTYTMQGSSEDPGIIRLAVYNVFQNIQSITDREFLIRVSYMEIYNEEINDLLAPENQKLQVHENLERGIFVAGLREEIVNSPDQVFELVELGEAHRHVGQTNMNVHSSRSHTIFRMVIESRDKDAEVHSSSYDKDAVRVSVLNLVDLAGSERVAKTGAGGARLREGTHINKSLMSLGTVINKLSDGSGKQRGHIPYRDSKLTRILQPALGGNAKTAIICTVAPEEVHIDETRGTLQFASRAKRVTNCAQVNEIVTDAALLKRQKREIEELRRKLQGSHSEVLELEILKLRNDMLKFELEREKLAMELEEERKAQLERDRRIMEQQLKIDNLSTLVINSDQDRNSFKANSCEHSYLRRLSLEYSDQERRLTGNGCREASYDSHVTLRREKFLNPSVEIVDGSGEKPDSCSRRLDGSPLPPNFGNIADEDMWTNLNKGHAISDLEFLQSTPNWNRSSVRSSDVSSVHGAIEGYREEIDNLRLQLGKALQEKKELEKCLEDQLTLNGELKMTIFNLENEATLIRKISQMLGSFVVDCKGGQKGISSNLQEIFAEENSLDAIRLSCTDEGNNSGPVNWKAQFVNFVNVLEEYKQENLELQNQCWMLNERLNCAVASPVPCKSQLTTAFTGCKVNDEFCEAGEVQHMFKDGVHDHSMEGLVVPEAAVKIEIDRDEELMGSNQLLVDGASNSRSFKREHMVQEEDTAVFLERLHMSAEHILSLDNKLALVNIEKDAISKALDDELHMREQKEVDAKYNKFVAEEFQRLNSALALREGIIASIHSRLLEFQESAGKFRALNSMSQSNFSDILLAKAQV